MAVHGKTLETSASPERVWRYWSDVSTWPEWNPDVLSITIDGPFAGGTSGRMRTRTGGEHAITLRDVQPGRSFRLETAALPLARFVFRCEVRPSGTDVAVISRSVTMHGLLGPAFSAVMGRRIAEGFEAILSGLKAAAESEDQP